MPVKVDPDEFSTSLPPDDLYATLSWDQCQYRPVGDVSAAWSDLEALYRVAATY